MFENSSEELASHKLLILYILDKITNNRFHIWKYYI